MVHSKRCSAKSVKTQESQGAFHQFLKGFGKPSNAPTVDLLKAASLVTQGSSLMVQN
jgi:hypothetical protein